MGDALSVRQVEKAYRGLWGPPQQALRGLTLAVPRGAAFGLIGPNGAGKTTFIKILLGVVRPTAGEVEVLGGHPEDVEVRARIGYLPERLHLPAALMARAFLRSVATLKRVAPSDAELRVLLERVGLKDGSQRIGGFSKGMRQRLGLAAALLGQPELLVLDEPTDGIDPVGRVEVRRLLLEEKQRGATILLNSHLLAETERVCDRVGVLKQGRLELEGALDTLRTHLRAWTLTFDGAPGETYEGDVDGLNEALDAARARGLKLTGVVPQTRDLEAVLTDLERGP
jgi:ABC-2 type transport system ATP-binding protein